MWLQHSESENQITCFQFELLLVIYLPYVAAQRVCLVSHLFPLCSLPHTLHPYFLPLSLLPHTQKASRPLFTFIKKQVLPCLCGKLDITGASARASLSWYKPSSVPPPNSLSRTLKHNNSLHSCSLHSWDENTGKCWCYTTALPSGERPCHSTSASQLHLEAGESSLITRGLTWGRKEARCSYVLTQKHVSRNTYLLVYVVMRAHGCLADVSSGYHAHQTVFNEICWHRMRLFRPSFFFTEQSATCQLPVPAEPGLLQNQGGWPDEQVTVKHTNHCSSLKLKCTKYIFHFGYKTLITF